jgi:phosphatidylserine/phosphatidylglycerophosphate/cardiolipin synthase-like enzyme
MLLLDPYLETAAMSPQEMEKMLRQTLADRKLSASEKNALTQVLSEPKVDAQQIAVFRNIAFRLVREQINENPTRELIDWLEDLVKLLHPIKGSVGGSSGGSAVNECYFAPGDDLSGKVARLFDNAKKSVDVCVFTITDDRIAGPIERAHRRGVKVRIITDDDKAEDLGSDIDKFIKAGIPVRMDSTPAHMHHKFAIFDETLLLNGSFNWTRSATAINNENFIITSDRAQIEAFSKQFAKLWSQFS